MVFAARDQGIDVRYADPKEGYLLWAMAAYVVNNPDRSDQDLEGTYELLDFMLTATASGQSAPVIDLMWGTTALGWRYDFLLVMSQFGDCHIRVDDLPVIVLGVNELARLWDGQDISARRTGCVAGRPGSAPARAGSSAITRSRGQQTSMGPGHGTACARGKVQPPSRISGRGR